MLVNSLQKMSAAAKQAIIPVLHAKKPSSASVKDLLQLARNKSKTFSVELLPTSTLSLEVLGAINPTFYSVIWRQTQETPLENPRDVPAIVLSKQLIERGYPVLLHLAGRYLKKQQALGILNEAKRIGVRDVFALKGEYVEYFDKNGEQYDFQDSVDLIRFIKQHFGDHFSICIAGYPDCHPHFKNEEEDTLALMEKVNAGADFMITQALFGRSSYKAFYDRCNSAGIQIPILPGIWLFDTYETLRNCANLCKMKVQDEILVAAEQCKTDCIAMKEYGTNTNAKLIEEFLQDQDAPGVHLFSLNNIGLVKEIFDRIKISDVQL